MGHRITDRNDEMASNVCGNCGEPLSEGARSCSSCGAAVNAGPPQTQPKQAQASKRTPKDKRRRSWLPLALAGAGVVGAIVVVMLWVGVTDVQVGLEKQTRQQSTESPSPPSGQVEKSGATGENADSQQQGGQADGMSSSSMFQPPKTETETGRQAETPGPGSDEAGSTEQETPGSQPDPGAAETDKEGIEPPPKQVEEPGTTEENQPAAFENAFAEGLEAARTGNFELAAQKFQAAVRLSPNDASAWTNLGLTQRILGDLQEAVASYQSALKIKPDFALAYKNLGVALEEMGSLEQAAQAYLKYVELAPAATDAVQVKKRAEMLTAKTMRGSGK